MALIQPNSDVLLLHKVPLDISQEHSITFTDKTAQYNYFAGGGRLKKQFADYSYQRHTLNSIKVEACADDIYDVNYMLFRNTSFGSKWFYAFVTNVEYINNVTSLVEYVIDDLQTWLFDFDVKECFVVREMPYSDIANKELVPEPLETGDYVEYEHNADGIIGNLKICALSTSVLVTRGSPIITDQSNTDFYATYGMPDVQHPLIVPTDVAMTECGYLPVGLVPLIFPNNNIGRKNLRWYIALLQTKNQTDAIQNMFLIPDNITCPLEVVVSGQGENIRAYVDGNISLIENDVHIPRIHSLGDRHHGNLYTPKNMKLFNYPYVVPYICDTDGNIARYKPEYFDAHPGGNREEFDFKAIYSLSNGAEIVLVPRWYKGIVENTPESFVYNKFPPLSWTTDYYLEYWARNKFNITASVLSDFVSGANSIYTGYANYNMNVGLASREADVVSEGGLKALQMARANNMRDIYENTAMQSAKAGGVGGINSAIAIGQALGNLGVAKQMNDRANGVQSTDSIVASGKLRLFVGTKTITAEMAEIIDNYFTMYGYATHKVKVPNWRTNIRPYFNYVQTKNTNIVPKQNDNMNGVPQDSLKRIIAIFENGITWWHNTGDYIGDYSVNNLAVGGRGQY